MNDSLLEFKVIETTHLYSKYEKQGNKFAFAIVTTTYLAAEPDAVRGGIYEGKDKNDLYVIARDYMDAISIVQKYIGKLKTQDNLTYSFDDAYKPLK